MLSLSYTNGKKKKKKSCQNETKNAGKQQNAIWHRSTADKFAYRSASIDTANS